ncbi:TonB-dependent receptor [Chitinimonas viridis]|uniref:TonB-dependent receptor n=1 Tax=Chitinimonas viridis TaxID=664880 RepID=A0ABT8B8F0_9NEIS|nr:TonB-dependent receptor [Chitinimonas viridis]MDN3578314.1 TonB-dependent receptor [Chitinimonas viridis]
MDRGRQTHRHALLLASKLTLACMSAMATMGSGWAAETAAVQQQYQIPAGALASQLKQFIRQSGVQVTVDESLLTNLNGQAVQGSHTPQTALTALLAGTGLHIAVQGNGRFTLYTAEGELATITVTGEKINRSLQETTTAVTVLRGRDVDQGGLRSVYDVVNRAPNVSFNGAGIPNMRGISGTGPSTGVFSFVSGARPRVSTSVDGVSESWSGQRYVDAGLWDIAQVEVMAGPQSTTQGRNTIGGAIVVNTKDPSFQWEGAARIGYENQDGKTLLAGVVSGPLVEDELAFRVAAEGLRGHGFIDYPGNWPWDPSEIRRNNVRAKLLWLPKDAPQLSAKLTVSHRANKGEYLNTVDGNFFDHQFRGIASNTRYQDSANTTVSTDISYEFSPALTGHFLYSRGNYDANFQESGPDRFSLKLDEESNTLESRLVYDARDSGVRGVIGLFYYDRHQDLYAGPDGFEGDDKVKTMALYGESTIALGSKLDLILGGRIEREEQDRDVMAWPGRPWAGHIRTDIGETMLLPKLGLSYRLSPETTLGFTARKGYNPGAGSIDWITSEFYEYGKEEVSTYELSTRSVLLDKRLNLNTNLFFNRYDDYQALLNRRFVNIPKGRSYGLEISINGMAARNLELFGSVGLLNTKVTGAPAGSPAIVGIHFNYAPRLTANLGFKQRFDSGWFVGADLNRTGDYYSEIDNNPAFKAGGYTVVNLNAGYAASSYTIRAYMKNATDEDVLYHVNTGRSSNIGTVGQPRTAGITLDYRY